jgi:hypothetical protein
MTTRKVISAMPISRPSAEQITWTEIDSGPADETPNTLDSANGILEAAGSNCPVKQKRPKANSVRFAVEPRDVPAWKVARRLHLTPSEFDALLPALRARRFPNPDPTTGYYDLKAVDAWMDARDLSANSGARDARDGFRDRIAKVTHGRG